MGEAEISPCSARVKANRPILTERMRNVNVAKTLIYRSDVQVMSSLSISAGCRQNKRIQT